MTDNEIIKALGICANENGMCSECAYSDDYTNCNTRIAKDTLDLINRQKAELTQYAHDQHELMIEKDKLFDIAEKQSALLKRYKAMIEKMKSIIDCYEETSGNKKARAEAITEFAERLKEKKIPIRLAIGVRDVVEVLFIDRIAKELKGGGTDA